jgi:hypothetical protein
VDWKRIALWTVLVVTVLVLGGLGLRLLRQPAERDTPRRPAERDTARQPTEHDASRRPTDRDTPR